jgi:hypothetical protein
MLAEKVGLLLLYFGLLVLVCGLPFFLLMRFRLPSWHLTPALFGTLLGMGAVAFLLARGIPGLWSPLTLSVALALPMLLLGLGPFITGLATLPLLASLVWWAPSLELTPMRVVSFLSLGTVAAWSPRLFLQSSGMPRSWAILGLLLLGLASVTFTGIFTTPTPFWVLWHHWGAFSAPAEAMLAGAIPFRDFPVQYGMGPTLLIALLGPSDPWQGTYLAAAVTQLLYLLAMGGCVLTLLRDAPRGVVLLALAAMTSAVLLWTGYPPEYLGPLSTPSVSGMRFLPLALVLLVILRREAAGNAFVWHGHAIWLLALLWSPEAAFHVTVVWWPYLSFRQAQLADGRLQVLRALLWGMVRAMVALALALSFLVLLFRLGFGDWPSFFGFITYVRSPPGILHPNLTGPIRLMLPGGVACLVALVVSDARRMPSNFVCIAALVAVSSYYVGRSHDNNLLNLLPFLVLALVPLLPAWQPGALVGFSRTVMAGLVAWPACFGMGGWRAAWVNGEASRLGSGQILEHMRLSTPASYALMDAALAPFGPSLASMADASRALEWLRAIEAGPPVVVNQAAISVRGVPGPAWTGMTNIATYALLPQATVDHFIARGAVVFQRPGWVLVDRAHPEDWLSRFRAAYEITEEKQFGGFTAYRLVPR